LYAKDFPDIVAEIAKTGRRRADLGPRTLGPTLDSWGGGPRGAQGLEISGQRTEGAKLRVSLAAAVDRIRSLAAAMRGGTSGDAPVPVVRAEAGAGVAGELGMSFEVTDVLVTDTRARVWTLMKVTFTGAAILRKDKAAYRETWIELEKPGG
jgi:hypothetical protein